MNPAQTPKQCVDRLQAIETRYAELVAELKGLATERAKLLTALFMYFAVLDEQRKTGKGE